MGDVVVGVDGSAQSLVALDLAAREARWRSSRLRVVYVYEPSHARDVEAVAAVTAASTWMSAASSNRMLHEAYHRTDEQREEAQRHAEARLRAFIADSELRGIDVQLTAIADERPTAALLRASADEDLLVVGSRGLGGFKGLLMGSVSQQCVHHATCPVLVVRNGRK